MRDTIAWSHDLLSPEEQTGFRRLAIFPGGCTIDAAEAVAGAGELLDVFAILAALVDESLLRQEESLEGEPRFRMLETVREYGLERLEASGEEDATRDRLAAWSLLLSQQTAPDEYFGKMSTWSMTRVDEELPNLRAVVTWLLARGEATRALRLLVAAEEYWLWRHITSTELHRWLEAALEGAPDAPGGDRAIAHWLLSNGNGILGKDEAQLHHAQHMLAIAKELGDPLSLGNAHLALARAWRDRGDLSQAAAAYATAKALMPGVELYIQATLGDLLILQGNLAAGIPMVEEALTRLRATTDPPWYQVVVINTGGYAALRQHDLPRAARLFAQALDTARELHSMPALQSALIGLAGVACGHGQAQRAAGLLGVSEAVRDALGMKRWDNWLHAERIMAETRAALPAAAFAQAWAAGGALPLEEAIVEALAIADEAAAGANS
jgi:hypothetical protein